MGKNFRFQAGQILYLQNHHVRLYCELIEHVVQRELFWVRPLLLVEEELSSESATVTDLRDASDLLWSVESFQPALDTEIITYMSQLWNKESKAAVTTTPVNQLLHRFIQEFWSSRH